MGVISPVEFEKRSFTGVDFFLLWAGAAVSLAEIWAGGLLAPMGFLSGVAVIVLGHLLGNTTMALGGIPGSGTGLPTMVIMRGALGVSGSYVASFLNVVQLVGWTGVMLWIGARAAQAVMPLPGWGFRWWVLASGIVTLIWVLLGSKNWKYLQRIAVSGLVLLCILMTYVVFGRYGWEALVAPKPRGSMPFMVGLDIVVAMPISWLPLVCDYSRFARSPGSAFLGTWTGYFMVSSWMYILGLGAAIATSSAAPDAMVMELMVGMGLAGPAMAIILLSTFTTTFLDIYSGAVSAMNIWPPLGERRWSLICGSLGILLAMIFPATSYEGFLLMVGSVFCPLFGVVLADFFIAKGGNYSRKELLKKGGYSKPSLINSKALAAWGAGVAMYHVIQRTTEIGSSIPSLVGAGLLYLALTGFRTIK